MHQNRKPTVRRSGVALIMVLVLIVMISLGVYSFAQLMTAQESGTVMAGRRLQARAAVNSGVEYLKDYLTLTPDDRITEGGHWNNAAYFQNVAVGADDPDGLRFSIVSMISDQYGEPTSIRYGLTDEGSKLNVNFLVDEAYGASDAALSLSNEEPDMTEAGEDTPALAREALLALPGMTETIADSILDWIDEDDLPRDFGAEAAAYQAFGYEPRNGPLASLDELLLVQGVTNELLYGADRNHNGQLDANEQSGEAVALGNASMTRGWSAFLTTRSNDQVDQAETTIDLNQEDLQALYDELVGSYEEDFAKYVVVYRQSGPYQPPAAEAASDAGPLVAEPISGREIDFSKKAETEISSVLDLLGSSVQGSFVVPGKQEPEQALVASPYMEAGALGTVLPQMMSELTAGELGGSRGVNTNHCSEPVLAGLPNIDSDSVQGILQSQDPDMTSGDPNYLYPTWPLGVAAVSIEQMKELLPFVAGQGTIFRAHVIGYSDAPGVFARVEVVIDASEEVPRVVSWRDLTHLGLGFALDTLTQ